MPPKKKTTSKKSSADAEKTTKKSATKAKTDKTKKIDQKKILTSIRGMHDILPKDGPLWLKARNQAESIATAYGYDYFESPIVEDPNVFIRTIGKDTDVIEKEMYIFDDREKRKLALRPELTASAMRAYLQHGMYTYTQPVKLWYYGQIFRHDRPQAGRYRMFHQFGGEVIGGDKNPVVDAEVICVAYNYLKDLGVDGRVLINSIGTLEDRQGYVMELVEYLRSKRNQLSQESKKRITKNPFRILDSKDPEDQAVIEDAPQIIDWLSDSSKKHFMSVLEYLDELSIPYVLTPTLVRGLDYYSDTVFEIVSTREQGENYGTLASGGRYDGLAEQLGGQTAPGCGFAVGVERVILEVKQIEQIEKSKRTEEVPEEIDIMVQAPQGPVKFYFAQLGEQARQRSLHLIERLRKEGIVVMHNLAKSALKGQLEIANKREATHTIILGQKETQDGTIIIRDMSSGIQEIIDQDKLVREINKILEKSKK